MSKKDTAPSGYTMGFIYCLFLFSGFAGLIYESIWMHYLGLYLGNSSDAQTIVLVIYMGGLALGAYLSSKYCYRVKRLFLAYAVVECLIGIFSFFFHGLFELNRTLSYNIVFPFLESAVEITIYKWMTSALLILPQTILLGATFPFFTNAVIRRFPQFPGKEISMLYFTNSFGAAIGVLMSWFVFVAYFGFPGTMQIAGSINIVIALGAVVLQYQQHRGSESFPFVPSKEKSDYSFKLLGILLLCSALTGTASFMYEIGWIRMLSLLLGSSTASFELMLSAFILGLALGGLLMRYKIESLVNHLKFLAIVQIAMAIFALSTIFSYTTLFSLMKWLMQCLPKDYAGYLLFNTASHGMAMLLMLPATICAGMTLPLITYLLLKKVLGEKSIGIVYAINTVGSIWASFSRLC